MEKSRGFKGLENREQSRKVNEKEKDGEQKLKEGDKKMILWNKPRMDSFWLMESYFGFLHGRYKAHC